ncbi:hypothetical protein UCYN_02690 [Candidatus Atelocyanobacterium thalassa isolate ALOHA]|uniref:Uncharacterized protein n=1 Tax=Atelocyanobacterium thalassa (isolate ALOHA) TaxID=1453429 RepID=D3ENG4_ATETH|nr:hypothetical protein UCYN_02690 [Candidatus Atelocyanobacterium thalassa isolate ALOHA]
MLVTSLIALGIASMSAFLSFSLKEDIVKVSMGCLALLSLFITLILAPWILKLSLVAVPLFSDKFKKIL